MPVRTWDRTHGKHRGAYLRSGPNELYIREWDPGWLWYLDGIRGGAATSEASAKEQAEAAARSMRRTHVGRIAASA